jgi:trk system potassium uptake protein
MAIRVSRSLSRPNMIDFIPLTEDYDLIQIQPPKEFYDQSLKDLNLRAKFNIHIIAINKLATKDFILAPPADYVIRETDTLMILGRAEDINKIKVIR